MTFRQQKTEQGGGKYSDISAFDNTDAPLDSEINLPFMSNSSCCWGTCKKEQAGQKALSILPAQMFGRHDAEDLT